MAFERVLSQVLGLQLGGLCLALFGGAGFSSRLTSVQIEKQTVNVAHTPTAQLEGTHAGSLPFTAHARPWGESVSGAPP